MLLFRVLLWLNWGLEIWFLGFFSSLEQRLLLFLSVFIAIFSKFNRQKKIFIFKMSRTVLFTQIWFKIPSLLHVEKIELFLIWSLFIALMLRICSRSSSQAHRCSISWNIFKMADFPGWKWFRVSSKKREKWIISLNKQKILTRLFKSSLRNALTCHFGQVSLVFSV